MRRVRDRGCGQDAGGRRCGDTGHEEGENSVLVHDDEKVSGTNFRLSCDDCCELSLLDYDPEIRSALFYRTEIPLPWERTGSLSLPSADLEAAVTPWAKVFRIRQDFVVREIWSALGG